MVEELHRMRVLTHALKRFLMRGADDRSGCGFPAARHQTEAQPCGVTGFGRSILSPTEDRETEPSEFESQMNRSRNRSSLSFSGSRAAIWLRISMRAPS